VAWQAGEWVLVQGAGGVSLFALQIATALGARVIVVGRDDARLAQAAALGAHALIDRRVEPHWGRWGFCVFVRRDLSLSRASLFSIACIRVGAAPRDAS
jgi:NADPH:quinone reductase-like Zn-dependent oxidoreductase